MTKYIVHQSLPKKAVEDHFLIRDYTVVKIWLGLEGKTDLVGLENDLVKITS